MGRKADRSPTTWLSATSFWQTLVLLAAWAWLWSLHPQNDGLWYQGDAPRHAVNGFFWMDYLRDFTLNAREYALSYFARYPAIDPASRPPVFYLLEGSAYQLLGPSPYVAKGVVLCFALLAAVYLMLWLREWISTEAAWFAGLVMLLPGMTRWSHAIMLNVPSLALGIGALYHARRWLEVSATRRRDFLWATTLTVLGILTYYPTGVVVLIIACWIAMRGDWRRWIEGQTIAAICCCVLLLLPFVWLIVRWAPIQLGWILAGAPDLGTLSNWTFYPRQLLNLVNLYLLCLALIGVAAGLAQRRWRQEALILTSWVLVLFVAFSLLGPKDERYGLPMLVPLVGLSAIGVLVLCEWLTRRIHFPAVDVRHLSRLALLTILVFQGYLAARVFVPSVSGIQEVATYLKGVAPAEPVFYHGYYTGIFTFYVRAGDADFQRRVVRGDKLLYAFVMFPGWRQQNFVHSPEDVTQVLQQRGGCRWLAIEVPPYGRASLPVRYLHEALKTPAFERVRSFDVDAWQVDRVDVYKLKLPIADVQQVEMPFPILGPNVKYRVRPIPPRRSE